MGKKSDFQNPDSSEGGRYIPCTNQSWFLFMIQILFGVICLLNKKALSELIFGSGPM